jgi:hypothetical protein
VNVHRKAGLDPTGNTYAVLMCGLAEKGDLPGIKKVRSIEVILTLILKLKSILLFQSMWN